MVVSKNTVLEFDSPFETQVYKALSRHGYAVHTQIGASDYKIDLAVVHPESMHRGHCAIMGSNASSRPALRTSSTTIASRTACCP